MAQEEQNKDMQNKDIAAQRVIDKAIRKYSFSVKEFNAINKKINQFMHKLGTKAKNMGIKADIVLGGSAAKKTVVKNDFDCDIFIRFDKSYSNQDLSDLAENILSGFSYTRVHGSRDYFQLDYDSISYEVVPVIKISKPEEALNITDISPLHVLWLKEKAKQNKRVVKEIIAAKVFFKANRLYGAESYISGFSGHVIDILIVYYSSFLSLLKSSAKWKKGQEIDVEGKGSLKMLNKSKLSALIVYDPIQPERNAAAALSYEKFLSFKKYAKEFLKSPSTEFFEKKKTTIEELKKKAGKNRLVVIDAYPKQGKTDIIGTKILKAFEYIKKQAKLNDFAIISSGWEWDKKGKAMLWIIAKNQVLEKKKIKIGPPISQEKNAEKFRQKNKETFIKGKRLYAYVERQYVRIDELIKAVLNDEYIKERLSKAKSTIY